MQRKIDFDIDLKEHLPVGTLKVGLVVQFAQDQESGTWSCTAADNSLGEVPANVMASLLNQPPFTAVTRSVKRAADDPEAISSVQIRISFTAAGEAAAAAAAAAWVWPANLGTVCSCFAPYYASHLISNPC
jgi:hypothetical protein